MGPRKYQVADAQVLQEHLQSACGGGNPSHSGQGSGQRPPWGARRAGGQQVEAGEMGEALVEEAGSLI